MEGDFNTNLIGGFRRVGATHSTVSLLDTICCALRSVSFCGQCAPDLYDVPLALFSVHFFNRGDDAASQKRRLAYLDTVRPLVPRASEAFFAGRFDQRTIALGLPSWMAHLTPTMDARDWEEIQGWAQTVFA